MSYLAELEEYISSLITYSAFKRDEPNAAIASIPLDRLTAKDFHQRNTAVSHFKCLKSNIFPCYSPICQSTGPRKKVKVFLHQQLMEWPQLEAKAKSLMPESSSLGSPTMWRTIEFNSNSTTTSELRPRTSITGKKMTLVFPERTIVYMHKFKYYKFIIITIITNSKNIIKPKNIINLHMFF